MSLQLIFKCLIEPEIELRCHGDAPLFRAKYGLTSDPILVSLCHHVSAHAIRRVAVAIFFTRVSRDSASESGAQTAEPSAIALQQEQYGLSALQLERSQIRTFAQL